MRAARIVHGFAGSLLFVGALLIARPVTADEVHMKNGSVIKATKIDKGEKVWKLTTDLGVIEIKAGDVVKVVEAPKKDPPPIVPEVVETPVIPKGPDTPTATGKEHPKAGPKHH